MYEIKGVTVFHKVGSFSYFVPYTAIFKLALESNPYADLNLDFNQVGLNTSPLAGSWKIQNRFRCNSFFINVSQIYRVFVGNSR